MDASHYALKATCQIACSMLVGTATAALCGLNPLIGAGIAAIAYLATLVAIKALESLPSWETHGLSHELIGTLTVLASWGTSTALGAQQILQYAGFAVAFLPSLGLVSISVIGGSCLGTALYNQLTGNTIGA